MSHQDPSLPPVVLREPTKADAPVLEALESAQVRGEWDHYDDPPEERLRGSNFGESGMAVVALPDGTAIGEVSWIQVPQGPNRRSLAWSIGVTLLREHRGHGYGAAAQRAIADRLLADPTTNRVQATTDVQNLAEQRSLELAGFSREGVLRGAMWRRGAYHDVVCFSRLRGD